MEQINITLTNEDIGKRLDVAVSQKTEDIFSRTQLERIIKNGGVSIDEQIVLSPSKKIISPCNITIKFQKNTHNENGPNPENIPLDIMFEDDHIIIINKAAGMVCHPAPGNYSGTLVNALVWHYKDKLSNINNIERPGIVHRLDKDTSGLMIVAKSNESHRILTKYFAHEKGKSIIRKYKCLVFGTPKQRTGTIQTLIARDTKNRQRYAVHQDYGKLATTLYKVEKTIYITSTKPISLIECQLLTGRTHQIRVHMKYMGCPIIGDITYGKTKVENVYPEIIRKFQRIALHSYYLEFKHPITGTTMQFTAKVPNDMEQITMCFDKIPT